jgi:primase-polymerase (primpol)-like protein
VIRDRSEELHTFHARHFAEPVGEDLVSTHSHRSELTDEEVEQLARGARNSAKFEALKSGDISGYVSHSEVDQAYVSLLAFYTQDEEQLDRLYRRSGLCRQKWLDRPDYRHRTLTHALSNLRETYTPDDGARMVVGGNANLVSRRPNLSSFWCEKGRLS